MALVSGLFLASSLTVIITPGPDAALIARLVIQTGCRRQALQAAAGMISAGGLQAATSIAGVSALLRADSGLFRAVQWLGAALLAWWGMRALSSACQPTRKPASEQPQETAAAAESPPRSGRLRLSTYTQGFLCTGTNPKVGLFLLAFLPQFVPPRMPAGHAMTILAIIYLGLGSAWLVILTELLVRLRQALERRRAARTRELHRWINAAVGMVFVSFAIRLALGS
jgi:threonine/homoserine/homoserine lactone efflux protein